MAVVTLARNAMATRFEVVLHGRAPVSLRSAGEEALDEIDRLEAQLSLFRPESEIAHINARAAIEPVRVTPAVFALLQRAERLHAETGGAFDITIAPLLRCWGFLGGGGTLPDKTGIAQAREIVGMRWVKLDPSDLTVRFERRGVMLDLGAIGKGYAIERAAEILREAGVESALLHGGTSTVYGLGPLPGGDTWKVGLERAKDGPTAGQPLEVTVGLRDEALSVSAVWGKCFTSGQEVYGHVLDPRTGWPAKAGVLAAVVLPAATETDALSTALLTGGRDVNRRIALAYPGVRTLFIPPHPGQPIEAFPSRSAWNLGEE